MLDPNTPASNEEGANSASSSPDNEVGHSHNPMPSVFDPVAALTDDYLDFEEYEELNDDAKAQEHGEEALPPPPAPPEPKKEQVVFQLGLEDLLPLNLKSFDDETDDDSDSDSAIEELAQQLEQLAPPGLRLVRPKKSEEEKVLAVVESIQLRLGEVSEQEAPAEEAPAPVLEFIQPELETVAETEVEEEVEAPAPVFEFIQPELEAVAEPEVAETEVEDTAVAVAESEVAEEEVPAAPVVEPQPAPVPAPVAVTPPPPPPPPPDPKTVSGIDILIQMSEKGEIDPKAIDIIDVTDRFLKAISAVPKENLRQSGKIIFQASVLLRLKAEALLAAKIGQYDDDYVDFDVDGSPIIFDSNHQPVGRQITLNDLERALTRQTKLQNVRHRRVTLEQLIEALREAERLEATKGERKPKPRIAIDGYNEMRDMDDILELAHDEDIEDVISRIEQLLVNLLESDDLLTLIHIVEQLGGKGDWVDAFLAVLFLSNAGKISLQQEQFYGPLFIVRSDVELASPSQPADDIAS